MAVYYVFMPKYIDVTAEVSAPDSRHARTSFLDYLSRSGMIRWNERQAARRQIITKRMRPGEIQTDIKLEYGIQEPPKVEELPVPPPMQRKPEPREEIGVSPTYEDLGPTPEEEELYQPEQPQSQPQPQPVQPVRDIFGGSPIVELSRRSMGL